jgi:hypothetical protein
MMDELGTEPEAPTAVAPTEADVDEQRARGAYFAEKRDQFAAAAMTALLPAALYHRTEKGALIAPNGAAPPRGGVVGLNDALVDFALDAAFQVADRALLARHGQLPSQVARLKQKQDAADLASSPAAPLLRGPGAA